MLGPTTNRPNQARSRWRQIAVRAVVVLLQSPRERARPSATRQRLIASLFGRASNVLMVAIAASVCGATALARGGCWISGAIAAVEVGLLVARCGVILVVKRKLHDKDAIDLDPWLVIFGMLAIASSMAWGSLCFIALAASHDPLLYVVPTLSTVGTAGAIAARNSGVPRLAKAQLACSLTPILVGCLLADDHGFRLLLLLVPAMAAGLVILIGERNQQLVELVESQAELRRLSQTDALTLLPNRRTLDQAMVTAAASGRQYALLMVDVDHFKSFNDQHGHLAGDELLKRIASVLLLAVSQSCTVARFGGEEFAILIEDATILASIDIGERLRSAVQYACSDPAKAIVTTISVGCAMSAGCVAPMEVLRKADAALYRAKRTGRNRVAIADGVCEEIAAA